MVVGAISRSVGAARAAARTESRRRAPVLCQQPDDTRADRADDALPRAILRAAGLTGFHGETVALPSPARATAAARAFGAGNGYLRGLIVDRLA